MAKTKHLFLILFSLSTLSIAMQVHSEQPITSTQTNLWAMQFFASFNKNLNQGNMDGWMDQWTDDATRITPIGSANGKSAIRSLYVQLTKDYENIYHSIVGTIVEPQRASVELLTIGTHRETGIKVTIPNVAILAFNRQGKVSAAHVYLDVKNIEDQLANQN